jgi:hypothetical protein
MLFNRNETLLHLLFDIIRDSTAAFVILHCPQEGISLYQVSVGGCSNSSVSDITARMHGGVAVGSDKQ